jgi:hypothetical protein
MTLIRRAAMVRRESSQKVGVIMRETDKFQEETNYLHFVQENIELRSSEVEELINNPGGATPASGYHVRRAMRSIELPDPDSPHFTRVDLENGETLYYGFGMLTVGLSHR